VILNGTLATPPHLEQVVSFIERDPPPLFFA
jgi:hypothetical protein